MTNKCKTKVTALECKNCKSIVYSRTRHDMRYCLCGTIAIDGGLDYMKVTAPDPFSYIARKLIIGASSRSLFKDYTSARDKYGLIIKNAKRNYKLATISLYTNWSRIVKVPLQRKLH